MPPRSDGGGLRAAADGTVMLSAGAERLWHAWVGYLKRLLGTDDGFVMRAPAFIDEEVLTTSRYSEHFPQHVLHAVNPGSSAGTRLALSPACCLHVYARESGRSLSAAGIRGVIHGPCARFEAGGWGGTRLSHFTMLEWVAVGSAAHVSRLDETVPAKVSDAFDAVGFRLELVEATDPFFAGEQSGAAVLQRMTRAKHEWRTPAGVAIGSINRHGDAFGTRFDISAGGSPAHSMCLAFGVERLISESLAVWGDSPEDWPPEIARP